MAGRYFNEETEEWENVIYTVDTENKQIVIVTDHLSLYGSFYVLDAAKKDAYIYSVSSHVYDEVQSSEYRKIADALHAGQNPEREAVSIGRDLAGIYMTFSGIVDDLDNCVNMGALDNVSFDKKLAENIYGSVKYIGYTAFIVNGLSLFTNKQPADEDILNYMYDAFNLGVGLIVDVGFFSHGVWILNKAVNQIFSDLHSIKMEKMAKVYTYYNDVYVDKGSGHVARSLKDWRLVFIGILEDKNNRNLSKEELSQLIQDEINNYVNRFWVVFENDPVDLALITSAATGGGNKSFPWPTEAERKEITESYLASLNDRLYPVYRSVNNYFYNKGLEKHLKSLEQLRKIYNEEIELVIEEIVEEGEKSKYAGYSYYLTPMGEAGDQNDWKGVIGKDGKAKMTFTLIGILTAGHPGEICKVELYKPGDKFGKDEPEKVIDLKISMPTTTIVLSEAPTLKELHGTYTGSLLLKEIRGLDELVATYGEDYVSDELDDGCDVDVEGLRDLEGQHMPSTMQIIAETETTGKVKMGDMLGELTEVPCTYNPGTGELSFVLEEEGVKMEWVLLVRYKEGGGIKMTGENIMEFTEDLRGLTILVESNFSKTSDELVDPFEGL